MPDFKDFWMYADLIKAAALGGGGIALMTASWWGGLFVASAGAIEFIALWKARA